MDGILRQIAALDLMPPQARAYAAELIQAAIDRVADSLSASDRLRATMRPQVEAQARSSEAPCPHSVRPASTVLERDGEGAPKHPQAVA